MRLLLFVLLIFSKEALSLVCDETHVIAGTAVGCTSLKINNPIDLTGNGDANAITVTNVTGNVEINANITLGGASGVTDIGIGTAGALGGPGASDGGGMGLPDPEDGNSAGAVAGPDGKTPVLADTPCANGGGGAGFLALGQNGSFCPTASTAVGQAGAIALAAEFDYTLAAFRGGFGGGAGAYGNASQVGGGGAGGGALHIQATGLIIIKSGVIISSRGGNGGNNTNDGGAGGGGSGGAIWLVSSTGINNNGIFDLRGGAGGTNSNGANGGDGADGVYRLESAGAITNGSGYRNFASSVADLSSDISCGTIASPKEEKKNIIFMGIGFILSVLIGFVLKTLFRSQLKF